IQLSKAVLGKEKLSQADAGRHVAGPVVQRGVPELLGLAALAEPAADQRELVPAPVAAQSVGHAGEVLSGSGTQQARERYLRPLEVALLRANEPFEEEQFLVVGADRLPREHDAQRLVEPAAVQVTVGNQGIQLADDGVARVRPLQALLE